MSFRTFDFECPECEYPEEHTFDLRGMNEEEKEATIMSGIKCPNCDFENMQRVFRTFPAIGHGGGDRSLSNIERMKKSFHERFVKTELDDVRHRKGRLYDDSIQSAAAQRIESDVADD